MPKNLICSVSFPPSTAKTYSFRTLFADLKPGDLVIADTHDGAATATFVGYCDTTVKAGRWLIAKVDQLSFEASTGKSLYFCKTCGELIADPHSPCPICSLGGARSSTIMLIDDDGDDDEGC